MVVALRHVSGLCCGKVCLREQAEGFDGLCFSGNLGLLWSCCSVLWKVEVKVMNGSCQEQISSWELFCCLHAHTPLCCLRNSGQGWGGVTVDSVGLACQKPCVPSHYHISLWGTPVMPELGGTLANIDRSRPAYMTGNPVSK